MTSFSCKALIALAVLVASPAVAVKFRIHNPSIVGSSKSYEVEVLPYVSLLSPTDPCFGDELLLVEPFFRENWGNGKHMREKDVFLEKILTGLDSNNREAKIASLQVIRYVLATGRPCRDKVLACLIDKDSTVRRAAVESIESNGIVDYSSQLLRALKDPDSQVKLAACRCLLESNPQSNPVAFPVFIDLLGSLSDFELYPSIEKLEPELTAWLKLNPQFKVKLPTKYRQRLGL